MINATQAPSQKKRKRGDKEEEVEDRYMRKIAREEAKEDERRVVEQEKKRRKLETDDEDGAASGTSNSSKSDDEESVESGAEACSIPKHETLAPSRDDEELEKAGRTIFLGNVSTQAIASKSAKKALLAHLASFIPSLPEHKPPHKVESIRFRSTAFASTVPKKAAFAKKELMDATTKSTNAYAVYSTPLAAREAAKRLNGTIVLGRHLRVDEVAHPSKTDHRRCVFVGNLGFVDDESMLHNDQDGEKKKKNKPPGDVEEGLWVQFGKAGTVESVRVVRDPKTRVGKGFAYVQFTVRAHPSLTGHLLIEYQDENGVEAALQFDDQKFPPLLPRKLRVVRAKGIKRNAKKATSTSNKSGNPNDIYIPKISDQQKSMQGRAGKLLGRAAAAQIRHDRKPSSTSGPRNKLPFKSPESFVFEGHRASSKQGTSGLKLGGKKKGGKPKTRSSKRGAAWKAGGGKKSGK